MIQIITADFILQNEDVPAFWNCLLELTRDGESYSLPATAPGSLTGDGLSAYFEASEDILWLVAQRGQRPGGLYQPRKDFEALAEKAASEIAWLEATIPQIDAMTAAQVRDVVKRLAQENQEMIKAWRYVARQLS